MNTQFLNVPEGKIAYDVTGSGPLIVCAPGIGDLRGQYRFLAPQMAAAGFRVATLDIRGHGESSTGWKDYSVAGVGSDILALINHLGGGPAVVVGHSMSAGAAVWAAAEGPDRVRALVLLGPAVHGQFGPFFRLLLAVMFARPWGPALWAWYYDQLYPTRKPADWSAYLKAIRANLAQPGRMEALHQMMYASKAASEERLERVTVPTLVVMGSQDPDFKPPEAEARWVAERLHGTCHMVAGAGHYPHVEMPDVTIPLVLDFLKTFQPEARVAQTAR